MLPLLRAFLGAVALASASVAIVEYVLARVAAASYLCLRKIAGIRATSCFTLLRRLAVSGTQRSLSFFDLKTPVALGPSFERTAGDQLVPGALRA